MKKRYKTHTIFKVDEYPDDQTLTILSKEMQERGGLLHFNTEHTTEGWSAQCLEIKGIITGGTNPNPSQEEIVSTIRDAIRVAFNISSSVSVSDLSVELTLTVRTPR